MTLKKPLIARDTGRPLVIFGNYALASDGSLMPVTIQTEIEPGPAQRASVRPDIPPCPVSVAGRAMESAIGDLRRATDQYHRTGDNVVWEEMKRLDAAADVARDEYFRLKEKSSHE